MTAFALVNADGMPTGGGTVPSWAPLPAGAIELPPGKGVEDLCGLRWTGTDWVERPVEPVWTPSPEEQAAGLLMRARAEAVTRVNAEVSALRARFQTEGAGQAEIYADKRAEAVAFVAADAPDLADFPLLRAEVGVSAESAWQLAQIWLWKSDSARTIRDASEAVRMQAMAAIAGAASIDEVEAVQWAFTRTLNTLLHPEMEP